MLFTKSLVALTALAAGMSIIAMPEAGAQETMDPTYRAIVKGGGVDSCTSEGPPYWLEELLGRDTSRVR